MSEMQTLFPGKELTLSTGEKITIKPFTFGQLPKALKLSQKIGQALANAYNEGKLTDSKVAVTSALEVLADGGEDIIELVGLATGKKREWFDTVPGEDTIDILNAFVEVNKDFFIQKIMPKVMGMLKETQA